MPLCRMCQENGCEDWYCEQCEDAMMNETAIKKLAQAETELAQLREKAAMWDWLIDSESEIGIYLDNPSEPWLVTVGEDYENPVRGRTNIEALTKAKQREEST